MAGLKINERIAFLRKQSKLTQEQLATALGVTNQSVSKWESGQCCPDIQLLPEIARFFHISTDLLLGYEADSGLDALCFQLEEHLSGMTEQEVLENSGKITALLGKAAMKKRRNSGTGCRNWWAPGKIAGPELFPGRMWQKQCPSERESRWENSPQDSGSGCWNWRIGSAVR
jgi:transcriptional regulator with XRE-family HTH domain